MKKQDLPENFWETIEKYHPNYFGSEKAMSANILHKYIEEGSGFKDVQRIAQDYVGKSTEEILDIINMELYEEAILNKHYESLLKQEKKFPNGFESWQETHFVIVAEIARRSDEMVEGGKVTIIEETKGQGGLWELAQELTDKFEQEHRDKEWDGEFFDVIQEFLAKELNINP